MPNIKAYMTSEKFLTAPINNRNAKFSNGEETESAENGATENSASEEKKD